MPSKSILLLLACYFLGGCVFEDTECEQGSTDPRCPVLDASIDSGTTDGGVDSGRDAMVDAQVPCSDAEVRNDAGACVECTATTDCEGAEVCKLATFECVQCLGTPDCTDGVCNTATNECVECIADADCADPLKPTCGAGNTCVAGCDERTDCARFEGAPACHSSGECRQCDPGEETNAAAGDCDAKSCDPATWTCTTTDRGALNFCQTCVADSECKTTADGTYRCVNITWPVDGDRSGNYCVLTKGSSACSDQMRTELAATTSVSGAGPNTYCVPRRAVTTCEAIRSELSTGTCDESTPCPTGATCAGGRCASNCSVTGDCKTGLSCQEIDDAPDYCG